MEDALGRRWMLLEGLGNALEGLGYALEGLGYALEGLDMLWKGSAPHIFLEVFAEIPTPRLVLLRHIFIVTAHLIEKHFVAQVVRIQVSSCSNQKTR